MQCITLQAMSPVFDLGWIFLWTTSSVQLFEIDTEHDGCHQKRHHTRQNNSRELHQHLIPETRLHRHVYSSIKYIKYYIDDLVAGK